MILADTHVHIHSLFRIGELLDSAASNFDAAAARAGFGGRVSGVLCLTESAWSDSFETLKAPNAPRQGDWTFELCPDGLVLRASNRSGRELWIAAGRQIVSRDDLEVLALFTTRSFTDRTASLEALVNEVIEAGALAVIPWGAGKWWGRRGRILTDLLNKGPRAGFFLGDNGGRPAFLSGRAHFDLAAARGVRVLPGTDPLPFPGEAQRAGGNGVMLDGEIDAAHPARNLMERLAGPAEKLTAYGGRRSFPGFVRNQIAMQWVKRFNKRPSGNARP